jgi:hypothetical protein
VDPIRAQALCGHREAMPSAHATVAAASELLVAAGALEHTEPGRDVETLPRELEALAEALRAAERACGRSALRVVPAAEALDSGICTRYQRAAVSWPVSPSRLTS